MAYLYIFGTVSLTVYGQLMLKWRIARYGNLPEELADKVVFLLKLLLDPFIASGFFAAFFASFFWMAAMTKMDLSQAYPLVVGGLALLTSLFAYTLLKEQVTVSKIIGLICIVSGILLTAKA